MDSIFSAEGLKFFVVVAIAAIVIFVRQRRQHRLAANPKVVKDELERLDDTVLSDVVISAELGMNDVSHVVVSNYGVFVITVKTEAGKVFGREGDREWQIKSGKQRDILYNPLWENRKHVNALEKMIGQVWFIPAVVFTRAVLKGEFGDHVVRLKDLLNYIERHKKSRLSSDKRDEIVQKLKSIAK